jgi:hypothetical protein
MSPFGRPFALSLGILVTSLSCNEELPPYREPETLLTVSVDGEYFLGDTEHYLGVYVRIRNIFEETLDGPASLAGDVIITAARDPSIKKTLKLSSQNLISGNYSPDGVLRIDPNSTAVMKAVWAFPGDSVFVDGGRDIVHGAEGVPVFLRLGTDSTCRYRLLAAPEDLLLQANLTVFTKKSPISTDIVVFPFCFITNYVTTKLCPAIVTMPPCNYWRR